MKIIILLTSLLMFISIVITACNHTLPLPESDRLAYKIAGRVVEQLKNKYDLDFNGIGQSGETTIKTLDLYFSLTHLVTKEEGRDLILKCTENFLHEINDFEEIRPYLVQFPFTYKNIGIRILFYSDARYEDTLDPNIWCISLVDGSIEYMIADIQNPFKFVEKESYEDALKIQNRLKSKSTANTNL